MGFMGDLVKTILITWIVFWVLGMTYFLATGQLVIGTLFLVGLLVPSSFIAYEYWKDRRKR
jgi:hypothetical protein